MTPSRPDATPKPPPAIRRINARARFFGPGHDGLDDFSCDHGEDLSSPFRHTLTCNGGLSPWTSNLGVEMPGPGANHCTSVDRAYPNPRRFKAFWHCGNAPAQIEKQCFANQNYMKRFGTCGYPKVEPCDVTFAKEGVETRVVGFVSADCAGEACDADNNCSATSRNDCCRKDDVGYEIPDAPPSMQSADFVTRTAKQRHKFFCRMTKWWEDPVVE